VRCKSVATAITVISFFSYKSECLSFRTGKSLLGSERARRILSQINILAPCVLSDFYKFWGARLLYPFAYKIIEKEEKK
jgi:hypothetical protein